MRITKSQQSKMVIMILESMQACIESNDTYVRINDKPFNLNRHAGLCWHIHVYTPPKEISGIDISFLDVAFMDLGLHGVYPVESQVYNSVRDCMDSHADAMDKYDPSTEFGAIRIKLIDDLIKYFKERI